MAVQGKGNGGWMDVLKRVMIGLGVCIFTMILVNMLCAYLITSERIQETASGYCVLANLMISVALGNIVAMRKISEKKLILTLMVSGSYLLALIILKVLCFPGNWSGFGVTAGILVGCGVALALLTSKQRKATVKYRNKKKVL